MFCHAKKENFMIEITVYVVERDDKTRNSLVDMISASEYLRVVGANKDGQDAWEDILKASSASFIELLI